MKCPVCNHERPRRGVCPHCGAEPSQQSVVEPPRRSSLRDWRQAAQNNETNPPVTPPPAGGRGAFGSAGSPAPRAPLIDPEPPAASQRSARPSSQRPSRPRYDESDYQDVPPRRSLSERDRSYDRDRYDDDRDYLSERVAIPRPSPESRAMPALPDMSNRMKLAQPPEYIEVDASLFSGWRLPGIIGGAVLGVILLTFILSGFGGNPTGAPARFFALAQPDANRTPVAIVSSTYMGKEPLVTPVPNAPDVLTGIATARHASNTGTRVIYSDVTPLFTVNDTINVVARASGAIKPNDVFGVRWYYNGVEITSTIRATNPGCCETTITDSIGDDILFSIPAPASGTGKAQLYYNGKQVATVLFAVIAPSTLPTPTPVPTKPAGK